MIDPDISTLCTSLSLLIRQSLPGRFAQETMLPPWRMGGMDTLIEYRSAAVLLLLFPQNGQILFPLIRRSEHLRNHQGQIALPGGAVEGGEDPVSGGAPGIGGRTGHRRKIRSGPGLLDTLRGGCQQIFGFPHCGCRFSGSPF